MHLITKEALNATVAQRWCDVHQRRGRWLSTTSVQDPQLIYQRLLALPDNASEAQITSVTGDNRWTRNICHECGEDVDIAVALGAESHHPTDTAVICLACLEQAIAIAAAARRD